MSISIQTIIDDLSGALGGTSTGKVTNLFGIFNRAAGSVLRDVDLMETKRIVSIGQVFTSVYDYAAPSDLKGNKIIDIRPQANRRDEVWPQRFSQWFDKKKYLANQNQFTVQHNTGVKSLRIAAPFLSSPIVVANPVVTTGWSAGGTASNIGIDTNFQAAGQGALTFDVTTGTGYIESSSLSPLDLTDHVSVAQEFFWVYLPSVPTSVSLRWGSDSSNYYSGTATAKADGTAFTVGWNLIAVPWSSASTTGTPAVTAIDYVRITIVASLSMVGVKFCYLTSIIGQYLECAYYSKYMFRTTANVFQEKVVDVSSDLETLVNVDTDSYDIFFAKVMQLCSLQLQGDDAEMDFKKYGAEYKDAVTRYKNMYPSEVQFAQEPYYTQSSGNDYNGMIPGIR